MDTPSKTPTRTIIRGLILGFLLLFGAVMIGTGFVGGAAGLVYYLTSTQADSAAEDVDDPDAPGDDAGELAEAAPTDDDDDGEDGEDEDEDGIATGDDATAPKSPAPKRRRASAPAAAPEPAVPADDLPSPGSEDIPDDMVSIQIRHTDPGVTVMIDGAVAGKTPLTVRVEAGSHQLRLIDGKASGQFNIDAGFMQGAWCFLSKGKKVDETDC
jgi:hypothetical protein